MRLKKDYQLETLLQYGFEKIDKQEAEENEEYLMSVCDYKFDIGHARRGQFYYLLISEESREFIIYASEPDGSGGSVLCPDVLIKLALEGIIEPSI